jgi:hypothetical protein
MIESTKNKVVFKIDENLTFPFPYRFYRKEDLQVFVDGKKLLYGTDFTVEDKPDYENGANVCLLLSDAKGKNLAILRVLPAVQSTSLPERGKLPSDALENQLDKIVMVQQQLQEEVDRCAKVPATSDMDPVEYLEDLVEVTQNSKDVALNAAVAAASSAQTAAISERNISLIWAEISGDTTQADNALLTLKDASKAKAEIVEARELAKEKIEGAKNNAVNSVNNIGAIAVAATEAAAEGALKAAETATNTAGSISKTVADEITIKVSEAAGAAGILGVAIASGVELVEKTRAEALAEANETLKQFKEGTEAFETSKEQGLADIDLKVAGVAFDVETVLKRAQLVADGYLDNAQKAVDDGILEVEEIKKAAQDAGDSALVAIADKRLEVLNEIKGKLDEADDSVGAAEEFSKAAGASALAAEGSASDAAKSVSDALDKAQAAAASASGASTSASEALASAQEAALSASNAAASALAASKTSEEISGQLISAHNLSTGSHKDLFDKKLDKSGGTLTGTLNVKNETSIMQTVDNGVLRICAGSEMTSPGAVFFGIKKTGYAGQFYIRSYTEDGKKGVDLIGNATNGTLTWGAKQIVRSVNGLNADIAGNVTINALLKNGGTMTGAILFGLDGGGYRNVDTQCLQFTGGTTWEKNASIALHGGSRSENPGAVVLYANNGTKQSSMLLKPDGTLTLDGKNLLGDVSKSANGYVKLPNGLIIQWGRTAAVSAEVSSTQSATFPISFPTTCLRVITGTVTGSASPSLDGWAQVVSYDKTTLKWFAQYNGGELTMYCEYIAIGY